MLTLDEVLVIGKTPNHIAHAGPVFCQLNVLLSEQPSN